MAMSAAAIDANPKTASDLKSVKPTVKALISQSSPPSVMGGEKSKSVQEVASAKMDHGDGGGAVTDVQKKMKRAERFGTNVQLTEEEKRNTRAERFGTGTSVNGSNPSKTSEELKRMARAERFGTVQSSSNDEETKKKARLARFATISQTDVMEADKRNARAVRFSNHPSSLSKETSEFNIHKETAVIAGKAGAGT